MEFNLKIFEGTDTIRFGMTREEIQSILKIEPSLLKSVLGIYDIDYYPKICKVFYELNKEGTLVCGEIEFFKPTKVFLDGIPLMGKPISEVEVLFKSRFEDTTNDIISGLMSEKYEIGVGISDSTKKVDSIALSRKGYRKQQSELLQKAYEDKQIAEKNIVREYICLNCKDTTRSETPIVKCSKCNVFMIPK